MTAPEPPARAPHRGVSPALEAVPADTRLWRVHGAERSVPLLYAAATRRGALFETVLHDRMPGSVVLARRWRDHHLTGVRVTQDFSVVSLHGAGLRSLGLHAADLTHTGPASYDRTTRWAAWLHQHTDAAGLTWTSHQDDDERAYVLFGDRVAPGALAVDGDSLPLGHGPGFDWTLEVAASVRVEVIT